MGLRCRLWGIKHLKLTLHPRFEDCKRTTVASAKGPQMIDSGTDIARAQWRVADSQSCESIADWSEASED